MKSVTETHCNRIVNHWTSKIYQIFKPSLVSLTMIGFPEIPIETQSMGREWKRQKKKNGNRWFFNQVVVTSRFTKNPGSYPANSLKRTPRCFYFLGEKGILNSMKVRVFFEENVERKHLCYHEKNYCYFCKSNIPVINLIVGSRNMIKLSKNMTL